MLKRERKKPSWYSLIYAGMNHGIKNRNTSTILLLAIILGLPMAGGLLKTTIEGSHNAHLEITLAFRKDVSADHIEKTIITLKEKKLNDVTLLTKEKQMQHIMEKAEHIEVALQHPAIERAILQINLQSKSQYRTLLTTLRDMGDGTLFDEETMRSMEQSEKQMMATLQEMRGMNIFMNILLILHLIVAGTLYCMILIPLIKKESLADMRECRKLGATMKQIHILAWSSLFTQSLMALLLSIITISTLWIVGAIFTSTTLLTLQSIMDIVLPSLMFTVALSMLSTALFARDLPS